MAAALQGSSRLRDGAGAASSCSLCSNRSPVLGSSGFLSPVQVQAPGGGGGGRAARELGQLQVRAAGAGDRDEKEIPFLKRLGTQIIRKKESGGKAQEAASRRRGRKKRQVTREEKEVEGRGKGKAAALADEDVVPLGIDKLLQRLIKATPASVVAAVGGTQDGKAGTASGGSGLVLRKDALPSIEAFSFGRGRRVDPRTVFVAGGLGQIGARISQKLLQAGFVVRAGVPDLSQAQQIAEFATQYGILSSEEVKRLNAVEFDFKNVDSIGKAVGNAGKAVVTVGPAEDGASAKVSTEDALRVLEAASVAGVGHFILVAEPGDGKVKGKGKEYGFDFFINLFNLLSPKKEKLSVEELIEKISESDLEYTVLKTAPTAGVDDFASDLGNVGLLPEGATVPFPAQVGRLQIAAVVEAAFSNSTVSENKVVEVVSSPTYSAKPIEELFSALQEDQRRPLRAAALAKAEEEERERLARLQAEEDAREAAEAAAQLEAEAKKLAFEEAKASAAAAKAQARAAALLEVVSNKAKELGSSGIDPPKELGSTGIDLPGLPSLLSLAKDGVAGTARKSVPPAARKAAAPPPSPSPSPPAESNGVKQLFNNLFKQDTLYVDD